MTAERNTLPAWAERERWNDLAWISTNLPNFWSAAILAYQELGRGAIVVETNYRVPDGGHPTAFLTEEHIARYDDEDIKRLVTDWCKFGIRPKRGHMRIWVPGTWER